MENLGVMVAVAFATTSVLNSIPAHFCVMILRVVTFLQSVVRVMYVVVFLLLTVVMIVLS